MAAQGADSEHERPVHREHLARDERRLVRREIRDRRSDVLGLAEAAERVREENASVPRELEFWEEEKREVKSDDDALKELEALL